MPTLFVLLPATADLDSLRANALTIRHYPAARDEHHLLGLVRAGRDPAATTWRRGAALAVLGGAVLGTIVNGVLASSFGMFAGLLGIALPLGFGLGAFLGGFTAAMTGTARPRDELRPLLEQATPGSTLLQWSHPDPGPLRAVAAAVERAGLAHRLCVA